MESKKELENLSSDIESDGEEENPYKSRVSGQLKNWHALEKIEGEKLKPFDFEYIFTEKKSNRYNAKQIKIYGRIVNYGNKTLTVIYKNLNESSSALSIERIGNESKYTIDGYTTSINNNLFTKDMFLTGFVRPRTVYKSKFSDEYDFFEKLEQALDIIAFDCKLVKEIKDFFCKERTVIGRLGYEIDHGIALRTRESDQDSLEPSNNVKTKTIEYGGLVKNKEQELEIKN